MHRARQASPRDLDTPGPASLLRLPVKSDGHWAEDVTGDFRHPPSWGAAVARTTTLLDQDRHRVTPWAMLAVSALANGVAVYWGWQAVAPGDVPLALLPSAALSWAMIAAALAAIARRHGNWFMAPVIIHWTASVVQAAALGRLTPAPALLGMMMPVAQSEAGAISYGLSQALAWLLVCLPATITAQACTVTRVRSDRIDSWSRMSGLTMGIGIGVLWWWWTLHTIPADTVVAVRTLPLSHILLITSIGAMVTPWSFAIAAAVLSAAAVDLYTLVVWLEAPTFHNTLKLGSLALLIPIIATAGFTGLIRESLKRPYSSLDRAKSLGSPIFATVNLLNILDAFLTWIVLSRGIGIELNPVITVITLPGKVVFVAAGSWLLFRWRPQLLAIPGVALALITVHHGLGWLFSIT